MTGRLGQCVSWRRLKWIILWSFVLFIVSTYIADWWSLKIEKTVIDGRSKYKLKARIHLGYVQNKLSSNLDTPQTTTQNSLDVFRKVVQYKGGPYKHLNQTQVIPAREQTTNNINIPRHKLVTSKSLDTNVKRQTTIKSPVPTKKALKSTTRPPFEKKHSASGIQVDDIPEVTVEGASCRALFRDDKTEMKKAYQFQTDHQKVITPDEEIKNQAQNCEQFRKERKYIMSPVNQEEAEFPIAFSILLFKDTEMVERLLRAIYRPQNYYCIHVDKKSSDKVREAMEAIVDCFDNVFMSSRSVDVKWGWYSVLEPEIICMEDLWKKYAPKWKYFINLTGQEFPLKTNWELVKILKAYNGANDMETTIKRRNLERTKFVHNGFSSTKEEKDPCPVNVTLSKGSVHIAVQSGFVDFVLHNPSGQKFLEWVKDSGIPDETFFSSLNVSPQLGVPGATTGDKETNKDTNPFLTRFKNWGTWPFDYPCAGKRVRMVCVFSIGDLPLLVSRPEMFANKFYPDYNPLAYDCIEQWHFDKIRGEALGEATFHDGYYKALDFVKHHLT